MIVLETLGEGYADLAREVMEVGDPVSPRGQKTHEVLDAVIVTSPYDTLPTGWGRQVVPAIGVIEALQLIGGVSDPELTTAVAPNMAQFMDGDRFHGAYGPRLQGTEQIMHIVQKIRSDRDTRQAVVTIWNPAKDNTAGMHDYPCTISLIFSVRRNRLNLHVTMRSNDVWWGLSYDAFQFTQLQLAVSRALNIEPGEYRHHAVSLHAYERDFEKIEELLETRGPTAHRYGMDGIGLDTDSWFRIQRRARCLLRGELPQEATGVEHWMHQVLAPSIAKIQGTL